MRTSDEFEARLKALRPLFGRSPMRNCADALCGLIVYLLAKQDRTEAWKLLEEFEANLRGEKR